MRGCSSVAMSGMSLVSAAVLQDDWKKHRSVGPVGIALALYAIYRRVDLPQLWGGQLREGSLLSGKRKV